MLSRRIFNFTEKLSRHFSFNCSLQAEAHQSQKCDLNEFIDSLTMEHKIQRSAKVSSTRKILEEASGVAALSKLVGNCPKSTEEFVNIVEVAASFANEREDARTFVQEQEKLVNLKEMPANDCLKMLSYLLIIDLKLSSLFRTIEGRCLEIESGSESQLTISTVISLIASANRAEYSIPEKMQNIISHVIATKIPDITRTSDLLSLLLYWNGTDRNWLPIASQKASQMLQVMSVAEMCSLIKYLAEQRYRDQKLLPLIVSHITKQKKALTVNQIVTVASTCVRLKFNDGRIQKRIVQDLVANMKRVTTWSEISSLIDSIRRWRLGDEEAWKTLTQWVNQHQEEAPVKSLGIVVSGMASMGIDDGRLAALNLAQKLRREFASSQTLWLSCIHSLAYYQALTPELAESVLNKDFVVQLMQSSNNPSDRLYKAMKLLQISASSRIDLGSTYTGPILGRESLRPFIEFNADTIELARRNKYGSKELENCNKMFFSGVLFKLAPESTHIGPSLISDDGIFIDAQIMPDSLSGSSRLIPVDQWGNGVPRPILYFGWGQTRQYSDISSSRTESDLLLGSDLLALRLMRAQGVQPIVIFYEQLSRARSVTERIQFFKNFIAQKSRM